MLHLFHRQGKAFRYLLGALLVIVAASMVTYLIPSTPFNDTSTNDPSTVLAEVGGDKITGQDVQGAVDRLTRGGGLPAEAIQTYLPQIVDQMVQDRAALYEFGKQGFTVTDDEVLSGFVTMYPQLFPNGKLVSTDLLSQQLAGQGLTLEGGLDQMRKQLLLKKVQNMAYASVIVTPQEINQAVVNKHQTSKLEYIGFDPAKFREQAKPTAEQLRAAYDREKAVYAIPEKKSFDVLLVDSNKIEQSLTLNDAQLRAAYAGSMDNFRTPERVSARHILVMTQGKPDGDKAKLKAKAEDLLKQLKGGADFAELAKKSSDDTGSAVNGGVLAPFVRGQMVPEFEKYAFSGKISDISPIVETNFGYHIIQVTGKEPAKVKPFDEVKDTIAKQLKQQTVNDKVQKTADEARVALAKAPEKAAEIAKQFDAELVSAKNIGAGEAIPGVGVSNEIGNALAGMKAKDVSEALVLPGNRMAVVTLKDVTPSRPADFADVQDRVRDRYIAAQSQDLARTAAQDAARRAKAGEGLEAIAKSMKLEVTTTSDLTINDTAAGLGPVSVLTDAFTKPAGTVSGPVPAQGRDVVYRILERKSVDPSQYAFERDAAYQELKQRKAKTAYELLQDSMLAKARADGNLKIYPNNISRLAASYRSGR